MNIGVNQNIYISTEKAIQIYGVSDKDVKDMDFNDDGLIDISEIERFGLKKYGSLTNYFDKKADGALLNPEEANQKRINEGKKPLFSNPFTKQDNALNIQDKNLKHLNVFI